LGGYEILSMIWRVALQRVSLGGYCEVSCSDCGGRKGLMWVAGVAQPDLRARGWAYVVDGWM